MGLRQQQNPPVIGKVASKPGASAQMSSQDKSSIKAARKLRRSNSCSDFSLSRWKQQGEQRKRVTSRTESKENLASIREYSGIPSLVRSTTSTGAHSNKMGSG